MGVSISVETIRQRPRALFRRQLRVPQLSKPNEVDRLNLCLEREKWIIKEWQNVLVSDWRRTDLRSEDQ